MASSTVATAASLKVGKAGQVFFSSLVAATFWLGCWQTQRYFEKHDMIAQREKELRKSPIPLEPYTMCDPSEIRADQSLVHKFQIGYYYAPKPSLTAESKGAVDAELRRVKLRGVFDYNKTVLVGPRGPPPGALALSGPNSGRSGGNMSTSPQGYFLVTPFYRADQKGTVLINRGWIPMSLLNQNTWDQIITEDGKMPEIVEVDGVLSRTEQPKRFSPPSRAFANQARLQKENSKPRRTLLWMDRVALEEDTNTLGLYPPYIVQTLQDSATPGKWPARPTLDAVGEFKVTPATHVGYAVTWFSLSGCGFFMTRKLLLKR